MKTNDRVIVHDPAWRDATGRQYDAGKYHGLVGTIIEATDYKVGTERMYDVKLDNGLVRLFWTNSLRHHKEDVEAQR